ncbi:hypothetical protein SKAU_G00216170 [Synaphobranchus kaupii]|uniref:Uncharacterized protein n=1 Tax=Synaphobranchus kaupii TaxID=118154 RepID=A0A9Q1FA33_SYNKA|nr:hypothetical protein SKAU_G00216170 [Synaphobranchus kaupii]
MTMPVEKERHQIQGGHSLSFRPHLQQLWNTLGDKVEYSWIHSKSMTKNQAPQLHWADAALRYYLGVEPKEDFLCSATRGTCAQ